MMPAGAPAGSGQRVIWLAQLSPPSSLYGSRSMLRTGSSLTDSPSIAMNTVARAGRGRFTQIADATDPVTALTPCHTPPAGRRSRRLVVVSRLHSSKPSFESASTISSGAALHPCSASSQVIRPCARSTFRPLSGTFFPPQPSGHRRLNRMWLLGGATSRGSLARADGDREVDRLLPVRGRDVRELEADFLQPLRLQGFGGELHVQGLDCLLPGIESLAAVRGELEGRFGPRVLELDGLSLGIDVAEFPFE